MKFKERILKRLFMLFFFLVLVLPFSFAEDFGFNESFWNITNYYYQNCHSCHFNITNSFLGSPYIKQYGSQGILGYDSDYFNMNYSNIYCLYGNCTVYTLPNERNQYAYIYINNLCGNYGNCYLTPDTIINFTASTYRKDSNFDNSDLGVSGFFLNSVPVLIFETQEGNDDSDQCNLIENINVSGNAVMFSHITLGDLCLLDSDCCINYAINGEVNIFRLGSKNYYFGEIFRVDSIDLRNISSVIYNGSSNNELPSFNFTFIDSKKCINETIKSVEFEMVVSVYDKENDTIYYGTEFTNEVDKSELTLSYKCNWWDFWGCIGENYDIEEHLFYPNNETCKYNSSGINGYFTFISSYDFKNMSISHLALSDDCYGLNNSIFYKTDYSYNLFYNTNSIYWFDNTEELYFRYYNNINLNHKLIDLKLVQNNSVIHILNNNQSSGIHYIGNFSAINHFLIHIQKIDGNTYEVFFYKEGTLNTYANFTMSSFKDTTLIPMSILEIGVVGGIDIEYFGFQGSSSEIDFSTTLETSVFRNKVGLYPVSIYVSDSLHYPDEYVMKTKFVEVSDDCEYFDFDTDFRGDLADEENYCPKFSNEQINDLICVFRVPAIVGTQLGTIQYLNNLIIIGLFIFAFARFRKLNEETSKSNSENLKSVFIELFVITFILYFVFFIGDKTIFVTFSVIGLLYLGSEINTLLGIEKGTSVEQQIFLSTTFFILLSTAFFGFMQIAVNSDFGVPVLSNVDFSNTTTILQKIINFGNFVLKFLFVNIPDVPKFLGTILSFINTISVVNLIIWIYDKLNPLN